MAATRSDAFQLSQSTVFQNRVQASSMAWCAQVASEGWAIAFHRERSIFAAQYLSSPTQYLSAVSSMASVNASALSDATQAGTVALTSGNRDAQAALVTDTNLDNAVFSVMPAFFRQPMA